MARLTALDLIPLDRVKGAKGFSQQNLRVGIAQRFQPS